MTAHNFSTGEIITAEKLNSRPIDVFIVGGGGGSERRVPTVGASGGGAEVRQVRILPAVNDSFTVTIGAGGAGAASPAIFGSNGSSTSFGPISAAGGKATTPTTLGDSGGWPNSGGEGVQNAGGGAGGPAYFMRATPTAGINGGIGVSVEAGSGWEMYGKGGSSFPAPSGAGPANTGNGAGGNTTGSNAGGSGIVIVAYDGPQKATGGTITTALGKTYHKFTSGPATFTWTG
jgi:hypothetical protein